MTKWMLPMACAMLLGACQASPDANAAAPASTGKTEAAQAKNRRAVTITID